jgi:hypothetical protein
VPALLLLAVVLGLVVALGARARRLRVGGALLGAGPEHLLGELRQVPLQRREAHLLEGGVALGLGQLREQLLDLLGERAVVILEQLDRLVQDLGILLLGEPRHARDNGVVAILTSSREPMNRI